MKFETVKSLILFILVGISLLLTLGLWHDSPRYEKVYDSSYVNEVDVGGNEEKKREIIEPSNIVFQSNQGTYFGFDSKKKEKRFYKEMNTWKLSDVLTDSYENENKGGYQIQVEFPTGVPVSFIPSLFEYTEEGFLPSWSFKRLYITLNEASSLIELKFVSTDEVYELTADVKNQRQFDEMKEYFTTGKDLKHYKKIEDTKNVIYTTDEKVSMKQWTLPTDMLEEKGFVDALFSNPSSVWKNTGEAYYSDGQRGMRISQDGLSMEYINPLQETDETLDYSDLLDRVIDKINDHKGWTGDYNLFYVDKKAQKAQFKLYYQNYPILNDKGLTSIEQQWRAGELYSYRRPLFKLTNPLASESTELPAGSAVIEFLKTEADYNVDEIEDIQAGYSLDYSEDYNSVTLIPAWFIYYDKGWIEIDLNDLKDKEGNG